MTSVHLSETKRSFNTNSMNSRVAPALLGRTRVSSLIAPLLLAVVLCFNLSVAEGQTTAARQEAKADGFTPFVFAVLADPQIGMVEVKRDEENFAKVIAALNKLKPEVRPSIAFIAGDLINHAESGEERRIYNEVARTFLMPVHVVPGNHDVVPTGTGKQLDQKLLEGYRRDVGADRFAVTHHGSLFIGINSQFWKDAPDLAAEQLSWLERQLRNRNRYRYVFIIQHHPLYLAAADEKDQYFNTPLAWRAKLLRLFEQAKVTGVLTGHLHRNLSGNYRGIAMLTTPSTCRNFDGSAFGYRTITVTADGFTEQYVGVPGTLPDNRTSPSSQPTVTTTPSRSTANPTR